MNYEGLLEGITAAHGHALRSTAGAVNKHLVLRNWLIGAYLIEFEQRGSDRAAYGTGLLKRLAADLKARGIPGSSPDMLERMRLLYTLYPHVRDLISAPLVRELPGMPKTDERISAPVVRKSDNRVPSLLHPDQLLKLSWTHISEIVRLDDPWKRAFYENECIKGGWSKRQLQRQIASLLYERTGLSTDKQAVIERARQQARAAPTDIAGLIRDPYVLEFVGLSERPHYLENDLERALLDHIQQFLLELGTGFCFEARQRRITVGNEHDRIDLVFYHRVLRCHLLIDLKVRAFQHTDAGQMNFYLNYWKDQVMIEGDNPPVGLLLCTDKENTKVEYATAGLDQQLFVSRYKVVLPKAEDLERLIEEDRAAWEQHHRREH